MPKKFLLEFPKLKELKNLQENNEASEVLKPNLEEIKEAVEFFCKPRCRNFAVGGYATFHTLYKMVEKEVEIGKSKGLSDFDLLEKSHLSNNLMYLTNYFLGLCDYLKANNKFLQGDRALNTVEPINITDKLYLLPTDVIDYSNEPKADRIDITIKLANLIAKQEEEIIMQGKYILEYIKDLQSNLLSLQEKPEQKLETRDNRTKVERILNNFIASIKKDVKQILSSLRSQ